MQILTQKSLRILVKTWISTFDSCTTGIHHFSPSIWNTLVSINPHLLLQAIKITLVSRVSLRSNVRMISYLFTKWSNWQGAGWVALDKYFLVADILQSFNYLLQQPHICWAPTVRHYARPWRCRPCPDNCTAQRLEYFSMAYSCITFLRYTYIHLKNYIILVLAVVLGEKLFHL